MSKSKLQLARGHFFPRLLGCSDPSPPLLRLFLGSSSSTFLLPALAFAFALPFGLGLAFASPGPPRLAAVGVPDLRRTKERTSLSKRLHALLEAGRFEHPQIRDEQRQRTAFFLALRFWHSPCIEQLGAEVFGGP